MVRRSKDTLRGVPPDEKHRRAMRKALFEKAAKRPSFKEYLLKMPNVGPDSAFDRTRDMGRKVVL
jgi:hypothetical protein